MAPLSTLSLIFLSPTISITSSNFPVTVHLISLSYYRHQLIYIFINSTTSRCQHLNLDEFKIYTIISVCDHYSICHSSGCCLVRNSHSLGNGQVLSIELNMFKWLQAHNLWQAWFLLFLMC